MSNENLARRTRPIIEFDGVDITGAILPYLLSVTYTDNNGYTYSTNLLAAKDVGRYNLRLVVRQSFQSVWQVFVVPFS